MANIPNPINPAFSDVYQLEVTDPVQGGELGIANRQARQLVERTQLLKIRQDVQLARGLGGPPPFVSDLNQASTLGMYTFGVGSANHPRAGFDAGTLLVLDLDYAPTRTQIIVYVNLPAVFFRVLPGSWIPLLGADSIVQSAGTSQSLIMSQAATTAAINAAINSLVNGAGPALDTLNELAAALGNNPNFATAMATALADRYTNAQSDARYTQFGHSHAIADTTGLAAQLAYLTRPGMVVMYAGSMALFDGTGLGIGTMVGWAVCNGNNGTYNMVDVMPIGAGSIAAAGAAGGSQTHTLSAGQIPQLSGIATQGRAAVQGSPGGNGGNLQGGSSASITNTDVTVTVGTSSPTAVNHMPPYRGIVFIQRIA